MKKEKFLVIGCLLLLATVNFAQTTSDNSRGPSCENCKDPWGIIQPTSETNEYTSLALADNYFWEVCNGPASISGSNSNQTVQVMGGSLSSFSLRLTWFVSGKCFEVCNIFVVVPPVLTDLEQTKSATESIITEELSSDVIDLTNGNSKGPTCDTCNDPQNYITDNGDNTFTASPNAQGYFWEVCNGPALITNGQKAKTVTVSGDAGSTSNIKLTMFINGSCVETCQTFTIPDPVECDGCIHVTVENNGPGTDCGNAVGNLANCLADPISSVEWYFKLIDVTGNNEELVGTDEDSPIFESLPLDLSVYDVNRPDGDFASLIFIAYITYEDGSICRDWHSTDLTCDNMTRDDLGSGGIPGINLYPNPLKAGTEVSFEGMEVENINTIEVFDIHGNQKVSMKPSKQSFSVRDLTSGIYIVRFTNTNNEVIQKKLIIE